MRTRPSKHDGTCKVEKTVDVRFKEVSDYPASPESDVSIQINGNNLQNLTADKLCVGYCLVFDLSS